MVEGPGHVPMDQIAANMRVQETICKGAPKSHVAKIIKHTIFSSAGIFHDVIIMYENPAVMQNWYIEIGIYDDNKSK